MGYSPGSPIIKCNSSFSSFKNFLQLEELVLQFPFLSNWIFHSNPTTDIEFLNDFASSSIDQVRRLYCLNSCMEVLLKALYTWFSFCSRKPFHKKIFHMQYELYFVKFVTQVSMYHTSCVNLQYWSKVSYGLIESFRETITAKTVQWAILQGSTLMNDISFDLHSGKLKTLITAN